MGYKIKKTNVKNKIVREEEICGIQGFFYISIMSNNRIWKHQTA